MASLARKETCLLLGTMLTCCDCACDVDTKSAPRCPLHQSEKARVVSPARVVLAEVLEVRCRRELGKQMCQKMTKKVREQKTCELEYFDVRCSRVLTKSSARVMFTQSSALRLESVERMSDLILFFQLFFG
jgi:hypothetical protein